MSKQLSIILTNGGQIWLIRTEISWYLILMLGLLLNRQSDNCGRNVVAMSLAYLCLTLSSGLVHATTWYVNADGTGDAPTIGLALSMATAGDTVLVGPGTYEKGSDVMTDGVVLRGEGGPSETRIVPFPGAFPKGAIACGFLFLRTEISGFWFDGFLFGGPEETGAISVVLCTDLHITNNLFTNNDHAAVAIDVSFTTFVTLEHNTFVGNNVAIDNRSNGSLRHNVIWDRALGITDFGVALCNDFLDLADAGFWSVANFSADPMFCSGDSTEAFRLQPSSPCVPANSPLPTICTEVLGAFPVVCEPVPVKEQTWGQLKSLFGRPNSREQE